MQTPSNPILVLAPRALLSSFISLEALLVLYMFAGLYKEDPRFAWIPYDPTGLFFALSVIVGTWIIVVSPIHKKGLPVMFGMVCLVTWFLVSLEWSPSRAYGPDKVFLMATLELWAVIVGALIIAPDPERVRRLFTLLLLFAIVVGIEALLSYAEKGGSIRRVTSVGGYLLLGRLTGLGALVALFGWLYSPGRVAGWICLSLFFGLAFVLSIGGGRGPLLATVLPLLLVVGLGIRLTTRKILYSRAQLSVLVLLLAVAGAFFLYSSISKRRLGTFERLTQLTQEDMGGSAEQRRAHYLEAFRLWSDAPSIGHGAGSWPLLNGLPDQAFYPHNLFAELVVESGLVGVVLFVALLGAAFRPVTLERMRRDPQALCTMMLFANAFLNAMVSGDIPGNRPLFMFIGVLALFAVARPAPVQRPVAPLRPAPALDLAAVRRRPAAVPRVQ
jgi:O-antigen ligase